MSTVDADRLEMATKDQTNAAENHSNASLIVRLTAKIPTAHAHRSQTESRDFQTATTSSIHFRLQNEQ